jgi:elongation factor Ts
LANISAAQVKELRQKTGAGMMDCKKALQEAEGELERAVTLLRERGLGKARGKAGRATSEGRVAASVSGDGKTGALVEVNCETDFVARTDEFEALCNELAALARDNDVNGVDALLALSHKAGTANDRLIAAISKLGENIQVSRLGRISAGAKGRIASYIHLGGKIGSLVAVEADDSGSEDIGTLAHNLCMHVAAAAPSSIRVEDLDAADIERERNVLRAQAETEGKPPAVLDKMVEGRLGKYFKEVVLLEQPLVMDPDQSVKKALEAAGATVTAFRRFQLGEEIAE